MRVFGHNAELVVGSIGFERFTGDLMESFIAIVSIIIAVLFTPLLAIQQRQGHLDYGGYAQWQIPVILLVLATVCGWLFVSKAKRSRYWFFVPIAYVVTVAFTNIFGNHFLQVDHSLDLPIRQKLESYSPPNQPPTKARILAELGEPLGEGVVTSRSRNVPERVIQNLPFVPVESEVLVYEETAKNGLHFTYYIFIDPKTGTKRGHVEIPGELGEGQWPREPLR